MKKADIISFLNQNDLSDVELLKAEKDYLLINFYFDFDKDIIDAAIAFANNESKETEKTEKWINDFYFPYLYDYANDEVLTIIEDVSEEYEISGEFMAFQMKNKDDEYVQFMVLFTEEDSDLSIEEVVKDYMS